MARVEATSVSVSRKTVHSNIVFLQYFSSSNTLIDFQLIKNVICDV